MRILLAAAAIPAALAIAAPTAHADETPNCAIGETEAAFAVNDLVDIAGDTGWFPSNFVAQLRLTAKVQSHTNVSTAYRATACWDGEMKAGLEGIKAGLEQPPLINSDPSDFLAAEQEKLGIRRLPASLPEALDTLAADPVVTGWFSRDFLACYEAMKRKEIEIVDGLSPDKLCARYAAVY